MAHPAADGEQPERIERIDAGGRARLLRRAAEGADRQIRVDVAQLGNDGVENGVVTAVALAVGPADHDAVALKLRAAEAADDDLVIMLLLSTMACTEKSRFVFS